MAAIRALVLAFALFIGAFALHIVGGATDQGWLFATAVVLIYVTAAGYPAIALAFLGSPGRESRSQRVVLVAGVVIAVALTTSALRAANDRTFVWWQLPLAVALVAATTGLLLIAGRYFRPRRSARHAPAN